MLWTGFILGFCGSLHCAGMCGPLVLALPLVGRSRASFLAGRLLYNSGRILTYTLLGILFGLAGESLALAGFQQWLSLSAGLVILTALVFARASLNRPAAFLAARVKLLLGGLLRKRSYPALFALGAANGLLPCGLVYVAAAAATATGHSWQSAEYMLAFGVGTLSMMLVVPILGRTFTFRFDVQKIIPFSVAAVAVLLILRGLSLGIPFLSPDLATGAHCPACH